MRTLIFLGLFSVGAVVVLGMMARRYSSMNLGQENPTAHRKVVPQQIPEINPAALEQAEEGTSVEGYLAIREALRTVLIAPGGDPPSRVDPRRLVALQATRDSFLRKAKLSLTEYEQVRTAYRMWLTHPTKVPADLADAFNERRERLAGCELGGYESSDL